MSVADVSDHCFRHVSLEWCNPMPAEGEEGEDKGDRLEDSRRTKGGRENDLARAVFVCERRGNRNRRSSV